MSRTVPNVRRHESPPFGEVWIEITRTRATSRAISSPPFGEVWIEMSTKSNRVEVGVVTSLRGGVD